MLELKVPGSLPKWDKTSLRGGWDGFGSEDPATDPMSNKRLRGNAKERSDVDLGFEDTACNERRRGGSSPIVFKVYRINTATLFRICGLFISTRRKAAHSNFESVFMSASGLRPWLSVDASYKYVALHQNPATGWLQSTKYKKPWRTISYDTDANRPAGLEAL